MKSYTMWLLDGKRVTLQAENYEALLCEIDSLIDILKENVCYYAGYDDDSIIEQAIEENINLKVEED